MTRLILALLLLAWPAADKASLRKEIARNANADRVKDSGKVQIAALRRMAAKKGK